MARRLFAVLPVKPFEEGKSRLAGLLDRRARVALNRDLFQRTLDRLERYPGPENTIVVSRCDDVLRIARHRGCRALPELPPGGLNEAVRQGVCEARACQADAVLVMPADLPRGSGADLQRLVESAPDRPACVLVPDQHGRGTNLLFQAPVLLDQFAFGPDSLSRHRLRAMRAGLQTEVRADSVFAFDIDEAADYLRWQSPGVTPAASVTLAARVALQALRAAPAASNPELNVSFPP